MAPGEPLVYLIIWYRAPPSKLTLGQQINNLVAYMATLSLLYLTRGKFLLLGPGNASHKA